MPVNLSFLEVIHNGGLSADQAKNVQLIFRKKSKGSSSTSPLLLSQNDYTSDLLTAALRVDSSSRRCRPVLEGPPETCRTQTRSLLLASPGHFLPLLSHLSSLGDTSSVCPNSFYPRSGSVPVGLFAAWRAGKPLWEGADSNIFRI